MYLMYRTCIAPYMFSRKSKILLPALGMSILFSSTPTIATHTATACHPYTKQHQGSAKERNELMPDQPGSNVFEIRSASTGTKLFEPLPEQAVPGEYWCMSGMNDKKQQST